MSALVAVTRVLGEYRLQYRGSLIGCECPDAEPGLVIGEEVCLFAGADCDSLGFVFAGPAGAYTVAAQINNQLQKFRL